MSTPTAFERLILDELRDVKRTCQATHDAVALATTEAALAHQAAKDAKEDAAAARATAEETARRLPPPTRALARDGGLTVSGASLGAAILYVMQHYLGK